ncbi:MAG: MFS transporter [Anaerolineales bacterium]|jgi:DHA3 family macrolide efflux protein-like MFS transporter
MQGFQIMIRMRTFLIIWFGQLISIIGSGLTGFGLSVWIYEQTGQALPIALNALFFNLPRVLLAPFAGAIADRYDRRSIMILADIGAAVATLGVVVMLLTGRLEVWHIYLSTVLSSSFSAFQDPAYRASITMLVPKEDLARAGGMDQMSFAVQSIITPLLAGVLYAGFGLQAIIVIDFATFLFAVGALALVHIPQPQSAIGGPEDSGRDSMWRNTTFGWKYLLKRPGLFGLLCYYAVVNFFLSFSSVLVAPLVLSNGTPAELGVVQTSGGVAMLVGGLIMSFWGGPKSRRIWGVIAAIAISGFGFLLAGLRPSTSLIASAQFVILLFIPISAAISQAVWQMKVAPDIQGRVFAIRSMIAFSIMPIANIAAGLLADKVFEPLMAKGGFLGGTIIGVAIGVGSGRGIALIFVISALFLWLSSIIAFATPRIRNLELEIPDAIPNRPSEVQPEIDGVSIKEMVPVQGS